MLGGVRPQAAKSSAARASSGQDAEALAGVDGGAALQVSHERLTEPVLRLPNGRRLA